MNNFLNDLKKNNILTKEDILLLKKNIHKEYPNLDSSGKANLLAKSIHDILNESLKGFTKDYKHDIKIYLIKNTFLNNKEAIFQYDVMEACAALDNKFLEFIYQVSRWVNKQTNEDISLNTIKNILQGLSIDTNILESDLSINEVLKENDESFNNAEPILQEAPEYNIVPIENQYYLGSNYSLDMEEYFDSKSNSYNEASYSQGIEKSYNLRKYILKLRNKFNKILNRNKKNEGFNKYILIYSLLICILIVPTTHIVKSYTLQEDTGFIDIVCSIEYDDKMLKFEKDNEPIIDDEIQIITSHLPYHLKYKEINQENLKQYLMKKNSLLSSEPYFSTIIACAKEFNINPLVLFSIAGHEQSFVPKNHENAKKIINNPYNVFQSWEKYNTDIEDSSKILCRTIINLLKEKPEGEDSFKWINKRYAEDKNWWKGVKEIYDTLSECSE